MDKQLQQIVAFFKGLTFRQRTFLAGSVLAIGGTLWVFVHLLGGGDYRVLSSGMANADAQDLARRLSAENIDYQISSDGGSVLVRSDQLDKARLDVASQGPLASGRLGFEIFDKPNWSGSDFSEKVNYQRALEAELERTIQTMNGVEAVRVHLVLPRESLFSDRERPAKAAVVLKLRGTRLTDQIAASVGNLVSSSWDDLAPQNVTVVTTDGQMPSPGNGHGAGLANQDLETVLAERVVQTLTPMLGNEHVRSSVTVDYDPTSGESTQELYDPNTTAVLTSQTSEETAADLEPSGIPGTPSNTPGGQAKPTANAATPIVTPPATSSAVAQAKTNSSTQGVHTESKTYAVSRTTHHLLEPAGRVRRVATAVLVDDFVETKTDNGKPQENRRKRTPDEMKQIEELAKAAIGFDVKRGDQFSLQNVTFTVPTIEVPAPPTKIQKYFTVLQRWTGLLRYVAVFALFAVVYLLVLKPVKKQVLAMLEQPIFSPALAGATAAAFDAKGNPVALPPGNAMPADVQEVVALKKQLVTKVKEDPDAASRLIQNWLRKVPETK
jgi:flagellar M-ring protein FliF